MAINFKSITKAIKASETLFVQFNADGNKVQVSDGHFIVEVPTAVYEKELLSACGTGLPTDKAKALKRNVKKGKFESIDRLPALDAFGQVSHSAKRTSAIYELSNGNTVRLFKVDNGENVWLNTAWADFVTDGLIFGGNRYKPIEMKDGEVRVLILPVMNDIDLSEVFGAPTTAPTAKVKDEPLSAPTIEVDEAEEETEDAPEAEEADEEEDELDTPESIAEAMIAEGEEEKPDIIEGFGEVPSDCVYKVRTTGTEWIYGNTKPIKEGLKKAGFHWAPHFKGASPKKSAWYRKPEAVSVAAAD